MIRRTPLIKINEHLFVKDESQQTGGSFKIRGVSYFIEKILESISSVRIDDNDEIFLVTQSTGNHGIAMLTAIQFLQNQRYPKIRGIIFGVKSIQNQKKLTLEKLALETDSQLDFSADNYEQATKKRMNFIETKKYGYYVAHGDELIMKGYSLTALEINQQLEEHNINDDEPVHLIIPVGAGGLIGLAKNFKETRKPDCGMNIIVQTDNLNSFIKSLEASTEENIVMIENPLTEESFYADGIAVDRPELDSLKLALTCIDQSYSIKENEARREIANNTLLNKFYGSSKMVINSYLDMVDKNLLNPMIKTVLFLTERTLH